MSSRREDRIRQEGVPSNRYAVRAWLLALCICLSLTAARADEPAPVRLELSRPVRTWEFLDAVGMRAGLFGTQDGRLEAWVYPVKLLREFHLIFKNANGRELAAESLARTITARAESVTITYAADDFTLDETWFVPVDLAAAAIELKIDASKPLWVEARFTPDMQMMWPAKLKSARVSWEPSSQLFVFQEQSGRYYGVLGAPGAGRATPAKHDKHTSPVEGLVLPIEKGYSTKWIAVAGSAQGRQDAEANYQRVLSEVDSLRTAAATHYQDYLQQTTSIEVPDAEVQRAYDWARLSMLQGMVTNPLLGTGLAAGYRTSSTAARPGFAWFFGRDSEWTSLAMDSIGDFVNVRSTLEFLTKFQRQDGKVEHEIAQSAPLVPWFTGDYAYASADATPLFLIAVDQYARSSGDVSFIQSRWDNLWRAYSFLRSTWDTQHHAQNTGVGHGWVEGGPLLPVKSELYQAGLGVEAVLALADMARLAGRTNLLPELQAEGERQRQALDADFWSDNIHAYAFALDKNNGRLETPSVLTTVPMWFGLLNAEHAQSTVDLLAGPEHMTDWGMRILSAKDARFDPAGYHYGSVWPLFTGWAAVGEYRYHRSLPAYANLEANALLTLSSTPGRTTEVLNGSHFDPLSESSPHQIWSSAMVISPILRGMMGLSADAPSQSLTLAPHIPAGWNQVQLQHVWVGMTSWNLTYQRTTDEISLHAEGTSGKLRLHFAPDIALRAGVLSVSVNGVAADYKVETNSNDQHVAVDLEAGPVADVRIRLRNDFALQPPVSLPAFGKPSRGVRVTAESWNAEHNQLTVQMAGIASSTYDFLVRGAEQIASVEGASLLRDMNGRLVLRTPIGGASADYTAHKVVIHFRD